MRSSIYKVLTGFVIGAVTVGGFAVANNSNVPVVKACIDNKTKALYASTNGSCAKGRSAIDIGATGANVKSIAQLVSPSVVSIEVTSSAGNGTGSGSIYKSNQSLSYIITNNHVIESAATTGTIEVELNNGEVLPATIVGRNSDYDLAVISIKKGNLPEIPRGNSSSISIGDPVIAFGSPLGLSGTVTSGIISALNRPVTTGATNAESYMDAIQTDAAINPGNSGGPLTDSLGRLVGVNSAIASTNSSGLGQAGNIGLGFAIPINEAKRVYTEIITSPTHTSTRPLLGVYFDTTYTGVGAKVAQLVAGEGAEKAGIPVGSVVTSIDGTRIADQLAAIVKIRSYAPGTTVQVTVTLPTGGSKTFSVKLGSSTN